MKEGNFKVLVGTIKELQKYKKVLLLTCSNRRITKIYNFSKSNSQQFREFHVDGCNKT